ncbi:putative CoA-substrate-specific enzyme activase [Ruminiclostridium sufflavum DSM 19573]|uniref:Putative CoA-substrate-specific enzyme activase n=1 Tax=Ruminiclostridium sufflavum DSM 19573 TaxID=1121337 RepID=A0A318XKC1_9FIRM|nr:acyl-CoA dehydratase activase [Ruminiclostridium sufflavum]PYG86908.1 putative CoA-substrate-specific enzyme activase [Ruminiclostridium sufflavum DSM 19573]
MDKVNCYMGIDVGSVSTNITLIDERDNVLDKLYLRTEGQPIESIRAGLNDINNRIGTSISICGVGTTGSGRQLAAAIVGADVIKNEITAHAIASQKVISDVRTIIEIGGQDSKIILLKNKVVYDFAMNTVCAAGTGSFLDRQASRIGISIKDFGKYALKSRIPVRIAGRCAVFAESDMIHKQQMGYSREDIIGGLCDALVRNYLTNLAKGKKLEAPIVFQGGVAANIGIVKSFERALEQEIIIPEHYDVMGAYGVALLAREHMQESSAKTRFNGFDKLNGDYTAVSKECSGCSNCCEIVQIVLNNSPVVCWGDKCGKWSGTAG